jgi:hypothetical protein
MNGGRPAKVLPPLILFAAVLAFYGRALGRPFTSEDFLLIRFLGENPPWRDLFAQLSSPWLGISAVEFYRPVSTLLYGAEIALFGASPLGYNLAHVLVHGLNAALVWSIVRRLDRAALGGAGGAVTPPVTAFLFAIYPLHPNAVIFSASFATVFGMAFFLMAVLAYQRFRESASFAGWAAAMAFFLLALGSYETAAVLPGVLAAYDHLVGLRAGIAARRHASLPAGYLPFFGLLGLYLLLRWRIFGVPLGGYEEYSRRLLAPQLQRLVQDLATSVHQLHFPYYDHWPGLWTVALTCGLLVGAPLVVWLFRGRPLAAHARLWVFAWAWCLLAQAPFAFRPSVPGNGRYWYLAAAGLAMSLGFLARGIRATLGAGGRALPYAGLGVLAAWWSVLLAGYLGVYNAAGETARTIQGELIRAAVSAGSPSPIFLTGQPDFLVNKAQIPIAAVFHYGVRDSVHPPFVQVSVPVYPLPPLRGAQLLPVIRGAPESGVFEWDAVAGKIRKVTPRSPGPLPAELRVVAPPDGARIDPEGGSVSVALRPRSGERARLIVVSRGNAIVVELDSAGRHGGILTAGLPAELLRTMDRLYGGEHYWWIEVREADGAVAGFTRIRSFRLAG